MPLRWSFMLKSSLALQDLDGGVTNRLTELICSFEG